MHQVRLTEALKCPPFNPLSDSRGQLELAWVILLRLDQCHPSLLTWGQGKEDLLSYRLLRLLKTRKHLGPVDEPLPINKDSNTGVGKVLKNVLSVTR